METEDECVRALSQTLGQALGRLQGVRTVRQLEAVTAESLAGLPATQLPCAVLALAPPVLLGRWAASTGQCVLWELPVTVGLADLVSVGREGRAGLPHWSRRLAAVLEADSSWPDAVKEIRREGPPGSLRAGQVGCVLQALAVRLVTSWVE